MGRLLTVLHDDGPSLRVTKVAMPRAECGARNTPEGDACRGLVY